MSFHTDGLEEDVHSDLTGYADLKVSVINNDGPMVSWFVVQGKAAIMDELEFQTNSKSVGKWLTQLYFRYLLETSNFQLMSLLVHTSLHFTNQLI